MKGNSPDDDWVHETRIGTWFLGTDMWRVHVLPGAVDELCRLHGPMPPVATLLDIGCGEGFAFPLLVRRFHPAHLIGIDIDPELVRRNDTMRRTCGMEADVRIGNATALDIEDGSVDLLFCHQSFHHLADQTRAAREFFRVLAPGGTLLFAESCRSFIYSWWVRLFFRHPMEAQKTAAQYAALLHETGFVFGPDEISTPYPEWSRPDFGVFAALGRPLPHRHAEPLVCIAARRPALLQEDIAVSG